MGRRSDKSKAKASPEKKAAETTRRTRRSSRKKRSSSRSQSPVSDTTPVKAIPDVVDASVEKRDSNSNSDTENKQVWEVKSSDENSQKLTICLQRPAHEEKSPRQRRSRKSQSDDSAHEEKRHRKHRRSSGTDDAKSEDNLAEDETKTEAVSESAAGQKEDGNVDVAETNTGEDVAEDEGKLKSSGDDGLQSACQISENVQDESTANDLNSVAEIESKRDATPPPLPPTPVDIKEPEPVNEEAPPEPEKVEEIETPEAENIPEIPATREDSDTNHSEGISSLNAAATAAEKLNDSESSHSDVEKPAQAEVKTVENSELKNKRTRRKWEYRREESYEIITSETVKQICPNLETLDIDDLKMDADSKTIDTNDKSESMNIDIEPEKEVSSIGLNRKISIISEEKPVEPPSPAKNPISRILFITNLVRPFTVKQLQELLSRYGQIVQGGFWTDRIKSKCYAKYETEEEADETRNALHGIQWPIGNGKKLAIDFATDEEMEAAVKTANEPATPAKKVPDVVPEKEVAPQPKREEPPPEKREKPVRPPPPIREWDVGKIPYDRERSRSRERPRRDRSEKRRHSHDRENSNERLNRKVKKKEEDVPTKLMDDLFRKTKSTPSIYWLPLTPEMIAKKQQERQQRMAEHQRRLEESRRAEREFGRGGGGGGGGPRRRSRY